MTGAAWLAAAVAAEAVGLCGLRASRGVRRPGPTVLAFLGVEGSVVLVGRAIVDGMSLAVAYALWTGAGIACAAVGGAVVFGDRLGARQGVGLGLVLLGVLALHAGSPR